MNLFYNEQGMGDVLIVSFLNDPVVYTETTGDVVQLFNAEKACIGVNIFNAKKHFSWVEDRYLDKTAYKQAVSDFLEAQGLAKAWTTDASFVVGHVQTCEKHPDSEKLSVCQVDIGREVLQIVCGAKNIGADQLVVVACPGAQLKSGLFIVPSVLRKVASNGMICSKKELDIDGESNGILVLDKGSVGQAFYEME